MRPTSWVPFPHSASLRSPGMTEMLNVPFQRLLNALFCLRLFLRRRRNGLCRFVGDEFEGELVVLAVEQDAHGAAVFQLAEQYLVGQRLLDVVLYHADEWPCAECIVVALLAQ